MRAERRRRELCVTVFVRRSTEAKPAEGRPWPSDDDDEDEVMMMMIMRVRMTAMIYIYTG